ncbi:MAG: polymerase III subunit beta protein [Candidatus Nomurabacteria bacterium GW2011_GWF1_31_48]|uniref:Beta sliding clamp n=2 Tax=Patescibacteria group TaxID=1783273 RepID=A0A0G0ASH6_9BACT|nr:MAG: polymerase III subunit beta protein [Candidatus Nomurabacteria bacterium GW2011_GWF1_31_48]
MKVTALSENLKKTLGIVSRGISSRPQLPVLSGVLLKASSEGLDMVTTDLEISFWAKTGAKVVEEGEVVVPARLFSDLVASLPPGPVELETEKNKLILKTKQTRAEIMGQGAEDYPVIPRMKTSQLKIGSGEFREKVDKVSVSAAKDDTRPVLTGMLWEFKPEEVILAATDGYRLSVDKMKTSKIEEKLLGRVILPARSLMEVSRVAGEMGVESLAVEFDKENQQVIFALDGVEIASRLISGEFPPYQQIMPNTYNTRLSFDRDEFADAVKRAKLFARENANIVRLSVEEGKVRVIAESSQVGANESEIEAEVEGEKVTVAFNAQYLLEYLNIFDEQNVVWETEGELKPSVFRAKDENWQQVIMPVRIQQ